MNERPIHVVKLGGSLLDLPDLPQRLHTYFMALNEHRLVLLIGGGSAADVVRQFDALHNLGDEAGHWLAVRAMQLNAHLTANVLRGSQLVSDGEECDAAWQAERLPVVDPLAWLERDEAQGHAVPHRWSFTSDSIAAHLAARLAASHLTLLKSASPRLSCDVREAARLELVDADLPAASCGIAHIELVNLRAVPPAFHTLK